MSSPGTPPAPAAVTVARPPLWRSPRLLLGVALVAASVVLGGWAVDRAASGTQVLLARSELVPGQRIEPGDVVAARLSWDGDADLYLAQLPADAVAISAVGAGELLPASAVGTAADLTGRPMAIPLPVGAQAAAGELVDLWVVRGDGRTDQTPVAAQLLAADVLVLGTQSDTGPFRTGSGTMVRLLVPEEVVDQVLEAQAAGAELTIVERPGG